MDGWDGTRLTELVSVAKEWHRVPEEVVLVLTDEQDSVVIF